MNTLIDKYLSLRHNIGAMALVAAIIFAIGLSSCNDDLDVQQSYPFTVEVMPFTEKIVKGQTVELRFEIQPEGNYTNTLYTIRYFQYDGEGTLKLVDGPVLVNNDRVLLESKTFRLNYTAKSDGAHKFLVVCEDNFGSTPWEQTFEFNGKSESDDNSGITIQPVNPGTLTPISQ
ncbi:DUF3872 domain-containing protein [Muribaculaceae bacterium Isolate-004 (NCI)]|uniref:DUF3872 domain-containing protein n=1 Tax=Muribaculaceae TaxID=2005473 RepID=UPI000FFE7679|nr:MULTISPECIES: DUF3872 domain-containing protein [Muribaculaceae]RXE61532.1 DUF3872 domain-containing protein [Muribaculaceae bacterium Isolate-004 (NCI)]